MSTCDPSTDTSCVPVFEFSTLPAHSPISGQLSAIGHPVIIAIVAVILGFVIGRYYAEVGKKVGHISVPDSFKKVGDVKSDGLKDK